MNVSACPNAFLKRISRKAVPVSIALILGILGGVLSLWLSSGDDVRKFNRLKENALCVLDLPAGTASASATLAVTQPLDRFHVGVKTRESREPMSLSISGTNGVVGSISFTKIDPFALGRQIQPGIYTVTLRQELPGQGAVAVIAGEEPVYVTGWQILSRTYLALLVLSGIGVLLARNSRDAKTRAASVIAFHSLLLGGALMFLYLLCHEGGHALAEIFFGRFDFARSDFWGIHGHPHSGGIMGPSLQPWQQQVISCAGPMLPTFVGFALFLLWGFPPGHKLRRVRPLVNLYFSATVAMLVFAEAVVGPAYLLGLITAEGDLIGHVTRVGGPVWLVKALLWASCLFSALVLWRVVPETLRAWKAQFLVSGKPTAPPLQA